MGFRTTHSLSDLCNFSRISQALEVPSYDCLSLSSWMDTLQLWLNSGLYLTAASILSQNPFPCSHPSIFVNMASDLAIAWQENTTNYPRIKCPSSMWMILSAISRIRLSWVTNRIVQPCSLVNLSIISTTSRPVLLSKAAVGSSAKTNLG